MVNIYSYKQASASAKALADSLGFKRIKHEGSRFRGNPNKTVINWGASSVPEEVSRCRVINSPERLGFVTNKLNFFRLVEQTDLPTKIPFTTDRNVVQEWLNDGSPVIARQKLTGHSGEGIVVIEPDDEIVNAPLYTKYMKKADEYRIHVSRNGIFDIQQKKRSRGVLDENVNWRVRNHSNGFIYARNEVALPDVVRNNCLQLFPELGLDFCAIDVMYNRHKNETYILEVNSAPGLEGTTLTNYVNMLQEIING